MRCPNIAIRISVAMRTTNPPSRASDVSRYSMRSLKAGFCRSDHGTVSGQRSQTGRIIFIVSIPLLILVIQTSLSLIEATNTQASNSRIREDTLFSVEAGDFVHYLQIERGTTALYVTSGKDPVAYRSLVQKYSDTNRALQNMTKWLEVSDTSPAHFQSKNKMADILEERRRNVTINPANISGEIQFYSEIIQEMINWLAIGVQKSDGSDTWQTLVAYHMLVLSKEQAGLERAQGVAFFTQGNNMNINYQEHKYHILIFSRLK